MSARYDVATEMTTTLRHPGGSIRPGQAVVLGGIAAGALDLLYCMIVWGVKGVAPGRVLQHIASGLLGPAAFEGGLATILLGVALEFGITLAMAGTYYLASRKLPVLTLRPLFCGALYGVFLYFFMEHVVIPLSLATPVPFSWFGFLNGLIAATLFIGAPCALAARLARRLETTAP